MIKNRYDDFIQNRTKVFLTFFLGIILYNYFVVNNFSFFKVDNITYTYHIVDFSLGFCTKLLPGAIFSFIFKDVMPWQVTLVETVLLFIVFAIVAYVLADLVCSQNNAEERKAMMLLSLFMLTGPVTFSTFVQELGMLDVYWIYFSILFFIFISKKYLYFLIPVVFVLSVLIHFSSLTSYLLLFSILIFYRISKEKNNRFLLTVILIISIILSFVFVLIISKNEAHNLTYSSDEFHKYLDSRYNMGSDVYYDYYDYSMYKISYINCYPYFNMSEDLLITNSKFVPDFLENIINTLWQQIHLVFCSYKERQNYKFNILHSFVLISPVFVFFAKLWINKIREERKNNKALAVSYFMMLMQMLVTPVIGCLCSPDSVRWFTHTSLIQFAFVLYVIFIEKENVIKWITDYILRYDRKILLLYWFVYSISLFEIYA